MGERAVRSARSAAGAALAGLVGGLLVLAAPGAASADPPPPMPLAQAELVGIGPTGTLPAVADLPAISDDGRYASFSGDTQIYLRDVVTDSTRLVSHTPAGANSFVNVPKRTNSAVSGDGSTVAFTTTGSNLVAGDTGGFDDVFALDVATDVVTRVDTTSTGTQLDQGARLAGISGTGRYVLFVANKAGAVQPSTANLLWVKDRTTGAVVAADVAAGGSAVTGAQPIGISADGTRVAFTAATTGVAPGADANLHVYVRDLVANTTEVADLDAGGAVGGPIVQAAFSADGQHVAWFGAASAAHPGPFVRDLAADTTAEVACCRVLGAAKPSLSADGSRVAFLAREGSGASLDASAQFRVADLVTGEIGRVGRGVLPRTAVQVGSTATISGDGSTVVFDAQVGQVDGSLSTALQSYVERVGQTGTAAVANGAGDAFTVASGAWFGRPAPGVLYNDGAGIWSHLTAELVDPPSHGTLTLSPDGGLVYRSTPGYYGKDAFRYRVLDGTTPSDPVTVPILVAQPPGIGEVERVSTGTSPLADGASSSPVASTDGRYVAFLSDATNLVPGDTNGKTDVFVRDRVAGTTTRINVTDSGTQANGDSTDVEISGSGSKVIFTTKATNLDPADTTPYVDLYIRDASGLRRLSTVGTNDIQPTLSLATNGVYAAFHRTGLGVTVLRTSDGGVVISKTGVDMPSLSGNGAYVGWRRTASSIQFAAVPSGADRGTLSLGSAPTNYSINLEEFHLAGPTGEALIYRSTTTYTAANAGTACTATGSCTATSTLFWGPWSGSALTSKTITATTPSVAPVSAPPDISGPISLSADGKRASYNDRRSNPSGALVVMDRDTGNTVRTLRLSTAASSPEWIEGRGATLTPDGSALVFTSAEAGWSGGDANGAADVFVQSTPVPPPSPATGADGPYDVPTCGTLSVPAPGLLANDTTTRPGATLHAELVAAPGVGALDLHEDGSFAFAPPTGFAGTTFAYRAVDQDGVAGAAVTVALRPGSVISGGTLGLQEPAGFSATVSGAVTFTASPAPQGCAVEFDWATTSSGITPATSSGNDYVADAGHAVIPAGASSVTVPVTVKADRLKEGTEKFGVKATNPVEGRLGSATAIVTITDDPADPDVLTVPPATAPAWVLATASGVSGQLLVDWAPVVNEDGTPVGSYTVEWAAGTRTVAGSVRRITVNGLTDGEPVAFRVRASNYVGDGPWSGWSTPVAPGARSATGRNLLPPVQADFDAGPVGWNASGGSSSLVQGTAAEGSGSWRIVAAGGVDVAAAAIPQGGTLDAVPGESYTARLQLQTSVGSPDAVARLDWLDATGAPMSGGVDGAVVPLAPGTYTPVTVTGVAPAGSSQLRVSVRVSSPSSGTSIWVDDASLVVTGTTSNLLSPVQRSFDIAYGWIGFNATLFHSPGSGYHGASAMRMVPVPGVPMASMLADFGSGGNLAVEPGDVIDASAWVRSLSGNLPIQIALVWWDADEQYLGDSTIPSESVPGEFTQLHVSGTAPAGAVGVSLAIAIVNPIGPDVLVDDLELTRVPAGNVLPAVTSTFDAGDLGWSLDGGTAALASGSAVDGTSAWKVTTTGGVDAVGATRVEGGRPAVTAGTSYTATLSTRPTRDSVRSRAEIVWLGANDVPIGSPVAGATATGTSSAWATRSVTATAPAGALSAQVVVRMVAPAAGLPVLVDAAQFGPASTATNLLTAVQRSFEHPYGWAATGAAISFDDDGSARSSPKTMVLTPAIGSTDASVTVDPAAGAGGPVAGQVGEVQAWVRADAPRTVRIGLVWWDASGNRIGDSLTVPISIGSTWASVEATGKAPPGTASATVTVVAAGSGTTPIHIDDVRLAIHR